MVLSSFVAFASHCCGNLQLVRPSAKDGSSHASVPLFAVVRDSQSACILPKDTIPRNLILLVPTTQL